MRIIIQDVKHLKIKQDLLWVGTATLATVVIWIGYAIYMAFSVTSVDPAVQKLLEPLTPSLDQQTLTVLNNRFVPPDNFTPVIMVGEGNNRRVQSSRPVASPSASASGAAAP